MQPFSAGHAAPRRREHHQYRFHARFGMGRKPVCVFGLKRRASDPYEELVVALVNDKVRVNYLIPGWVLSPTELRIRAEEGRDEEWIEEN
jgi:hypothetical protein